MNFVIINLSVQVGIVEVCKSTCSQTCVLALSLRLLLYTLYKYAILIDQVCLT